MTSHNGLEGKDLLTYHVNESIRIALEIGRAYAAGNTNLMEHLWKQLKAHHHAITEFNEEPTDE